MFTPVKRHDGPLSPRPDRYLVYGWRRSYFTQKLMAALHFYGADWEFRRKRPEREQEIRLRSGTHQVPVLHTPENWMIADTTPILDLLDGRFPERRMFPSGPLGALTHLVEEFFDEWVARTTVHWRWNYKENHTLVSLDAADGDPDAAADLIAWGGKVCRATGVSSQTQQRAAEDEYHRIMAAAEAQLRETRFLLGDRPTAVDCIVLAGLRAHFLVDPAPNRILRGRYPGVVRWAEQEADLWAGGGALASFPESTAFARFVVFTMSATWAPFALANRDALSREKRAFVIPIYGEDVSYLARPYIEQSRLMLARRAAAAGPAFAQWIAGTGLVEALADRCGAPKVIGEAPANQGA